MNHAATGSQNGISRMRNIGISAHIDSGKTTLTERILYYCNKIHAIHEVKGKDGVGATMDSMDLERERGITIASAATNVDWKGYSINIIDTPGHVDFTIEVERALRVLDGAILVLCSVAGVQSQTITVDRQLRRYRVPRLAFINKCDRVGADPVKVADQLKEKLGQNAVLMQIPIGLEEDHVGVVDLVTMKANYFDGASGEIVRIEDPPENLLEEAKTRREQMMDALTYFSDELAESYLEGRETEAQICEAARRGTLALELTPVLMGSAYRNRGIQPLLDAILRYLPSPAETENTAYDLDNEQKTVKLEADPGKPTVALAFKLEASSYGQLTYIRIYQGTVEKGKDLFIVGSRKRIKVNRLVRMHADKMEEIGSASAGDIVALFGIDCSSGDTFVESGINLSLSSMHVPHPVISLAVNPKDKKASDNMTKALIRFTKEDPTFRTYVDEETNETIVQGMGELHLDVYLERMRREYGAEVETGKPQVAYRETVTRRTEFDYTHKKQTGGAGQFGKVVGVLEPNTETDYEFVNQIRGGAIPTEYIPSCDRGFQSCLKKGALTGFPIVGVKLTLTDGNSHPVDSSDIAFRAAAVGAFRQAYSKAKPIILEPIMRVAVECPKEFQGTAFASVNQRRGTIVSSSEDATFCRIEAEVPLGEMFGYSTILRSLTQGKGEFTMEFERYGRLPASLAEELQKTLAQKQKAPAQKQKTLAQK
jgi:elongation factor G